MSFSYVYCGGWSNFRGEIANFKGEVRGLKCLKWDAETGVLTEHGIYGEQLLGQSILAVAGDVLTAVCELGKGGKVVSYRIKPDGSLEMADILEFSSAKLSYCVASPNGKYVFVSSMGDGTVKMIRIGEDAKLTLTDEFQLTGHSLTPRQSQAKVHSVMISPDGKFLGAANLGADELEIFRVDYEKEILRLACSKPVDWGKEPRHMAFHPSGRYLYLLTESGNRIYDYRITEEGRLQELAVYTTLDPDGPVVGAAADIVVSKDGRFVYSSNRGQSNVAVWRILDNGLLDSVAFVPCGGKGPRGLTISPDGKHLLCANNDDGTVTVLPLDLQTGIPGAPTASAQVPCAACVRVRQ